MVDGTGLDVETLTIEPLPPVSRSALSALIVDLLRRLRKAHDELRRARTEAATLREFLQAALDNHHKLHVEHERQTERYHALLDERRAANARAGAHLNEREP